MNVKSALDFGEFVSRGVTSDEGDTHLLPPPLLSTPLATGREYFKSRRRSEERGGKVPIFTSLKWSGGVFSPYGLVAGER